MVVGAAGVVSSENAWLLVFEIDQQKKAHQISGRPFGFFATRPLAAKTTNQISPLEFGFLMLLDLACLKNYFGHFNPFALGRGGK
jgi:hypothetical protein